MDAGNKIYTIISVILLTTNTLTVNGRYNIFSQDGDKIQSDGVDQYYPYHEMTGGIGGGHEQGFVSDWNRNWPTIHGNEPKCIDIPTNLTLCHGIGYKQMRLPNLLEHDTLGEVTSQAATWVPLKGIACHPDTQLFLCSLFSPVCLDRPIYPCRNLCEAVKAGCESRMNHYGFPWPEILTCDKFPLNNDLCIGPQSENPDSKCSACQQPNTFEAFVDNFCRADIVLRVKIRKEITLDSGKKLKLGKKKRIFKRGTIKKKELAKLDLFVEDSQKCDCGLPEPGKENNQYFVMCEKKRNKVVVKSIHLYDKTNKDMKKALRAIRKKDEICKKKGMEMLLVNDDPYINGLDKPKKKGGKSNKKTSKKALGNKRNGNVGNTPDSNENVSDATVPTTMSGQQQSQTTSKTARRNSNKKSKKGKSRNKANRRRQQGNKKSRTRDSTPQAT